MTPPLVHRYNLGTWLNGKRLTGEGVEVGVYYGVNADMLLSRWHGEALYLVDPWATQSKEVYVDGCNKDDFSQVYRDCMNRLARHRNRAIVRRGYSKELAYTFTDRSLDFAYIDARHDYDGVMEDLVAWWPKVKQGGVMAGHDYKQDIRPGVFICEVERAVNDFFKDKDVEVRVTAEEVKTWYIEKNSK